MNLRDLCNKNLKSENTLLCVSECADFWIVITSINAADLSMNYYANEFIYHLTYFHCEDYYKNIYDAILLNTREALVNYTITNKMTDNNIIHIDEDVLQLFTTFSKGSVHGYSGFYYTIIQYIHHIAEYKNVKILVYKHSQEGILSVIHHLCNMNIIDKNNIIYIENDKYYFFKSVRYIPNEYHVFTGEFINMVDEFKNKYLILENNTRPPYNNICILKSDDTNNLSNNGKFDTITINNFCDKWDFIQINPKNEIELINDIHHCKRLVVSYGSAFFKNMFYISDKCEKIIVVISGESYKSDYNNLSSVVPSKFQGIIMKNYKNATIEYKITNDNELQFIPY